MTQTAPEIADLQELSAKMDSVLAGLVEVTGKLASIDSRFVRIEAVVETELRPLLESPLVKTWRKRLGAKHG